MDKALINRKPFISIVGFAFTLFLWFAAMHVMQLFNLNYWIGVTIGAVALVFMLIIFIIRRKNLTLPLTLSAILINAIASGIALSSMYEYLGAHPTLWQSSAVFAALVALFGLYCLLTTLTLFQKHYVICEITLVILAVAAVILGMIFSDLSTFSLAAVGLIPFIAFIVAMTLRSQDFTGHAKNIACCSFAVLAIVIFVVLTVLTQGEAVDGLAPDGPSGKKKNEIKNVYDYLPKGK